MKSILLVDDETQISAEIERTLGRYGFLVETAGTLELALRAIEQSQFDAVLLEFNLRSDRKAHPRTGSGLEVVRRLRASGMQTPAILFTAMEGLLYEKASLEAGADEFIRKADGITHLVIRLRAQIQRSASEIKSRSSHRLLRKSLKPKKVERTSTELI